MKWKGACLLLYSLSRVWLIVSIRCRHQREKRSAEAEAQKLVQGLSGEKARVTQSVQSAVDRCTVAEEQRDTSLLSMDLAKDALLSLEVRLAFSSLVLLSRQYSLRAPTRGRA